MKKEAPALLPIFRSQLQAELLAWMYLRPWAEATLSEAARYVGVQPGALHAEVERLVDAGLLSDRRVGRSRLLRANLNGRVAGPLTQLLLASFGPRVVVAQEFAQVAGSPQVAIYGSWARRFRGEVGREPADVDVMVIGAVDRDDVYAAAERAQERLSVPVHTTIRSQESWDAGVDPLVLTAKADAVMVIGEGVDET